MEARLPRYCKTTRWFHWTFALSFLALATTGAVLLLREALALEHGTVLGLVNAHKIIAVVFFSAPWLIAASGDTRRWLADMAEAMRFGRHDLEWLRGQGPALLRGTPLPAQDKLNAGQKLNAIAIAGIAGVMAGSGLHLWGDPGAFIALLLHLGGFIAWIPAFAVHLFMALVNPSTRPALRGMVLGDVSRNWAEHHHGRWVERLDEECGEADG